MNADYPIIAFPLLPLLGIVVSLSIKYSLNRDVSVIAIVANSILQLLTGLILVITFYNFDGFYTVILSEWKHSIELSFDSNRIFFLIAYLTPVLLTIFHHKKLTGFNIRILFMFYLSGCSGLIVAGDIFNFYIFYEVMIMSAYILIAVNKKYFASIKYMVFGAASSAVFLAGIILLYASGSYFSYTSIYNNITDFNPANTQFILLFFSIAFFIKAAFFPVSGWVATCHSATNSLISCFLASFTIFSGIMGLFYFVIIPAGMVGEHSILRFVSLLSVLTILIPSLILFFEPDLKRCIAGSTIFTIGFIGLFLAGGAHKLALFYVALHALYKSYMFLAYDDLKVCKNQVKGRKRTITVFVITVLFTVGFFPALTYFVKYNYIEDFLPLKLAAFVSMFLVLGSFLKFSYKHEKSKSKTGYYLLFPLILAGYYVLFPFSWPHTGLYLTADAAVLFLAFYGSAYINRKISALRGMDTKFIYININYELLYIVMLFIVQILVMRIVS